MAENEFLDLVTDLRGQLEEQILLDEINKKIVATLDLDEVLKEISDSTCKLLQCDRTTVYMIERSLRGEGRELISRFAVGDDIKEIRVAYDNKSIAGYVAVSGETVCLKDVYDEAELTAICSELSFNRSWDEKTGYRTKSMLVAPAVARDRTIGVIQALNKNGGVPFDEHDFQLMEKLANFVGIALQNSQAHTSIIRRQKTRTTVNDLLVEKGLISEIKLKEAQERAKKDRKKLPEILVEQYDVPEVEITKCLAEINDVEYLGFSPEMIINPDLFNNIPEAYCKRHHICPYKQTLDPKSGDLQLQVIMANPKDFVALEDIEIRAQSKVSKIFMSTRGDIARMIRHTLHPDAAQSDDDRESVGDLFDALAEELGVESDFDAEVEAVSIKEGAKEEDAPIVKLCNRIVEEAYRMGGSDIHIEPMETYVQVRVRRDGSLEKTLNVPLHAKNALVARYKIMGEMNITEHRVPQDGRIAFKQHGGRYDVELRVNICPTVGGNEDVVMRILADSKPLPLEKMGFQPWVMQPFKHEFEKPYGMILVVGPTGSGKTTTLHATVANINTPDRKILTAENPVEITQAGLRQVQIRPEQGMTFKSALRAFLRQDPDVIMVGEMRDFETCSIAVEAALTGHLLFSTLHTNNAPETVTRLIDIGIDPVTLSDALLCVLAQRLTKTLCPKCKQKGQLDLQELTEIGASIEGDTYKLIDREFPLDGTFLRGDGCETCNGSGLKGRTGIHELLVCNDEVKRMIVSGARIAEIREAATTPDATGYRMYELFEDGYFKALQGATEIAQIRAVCVE